MARKKIAVEDSIFDKKVPLKNRPGKSIFVLAFIVIVLITICAIAYYLLIPKNSFKNPTAAQVVESVGKLVKLPENETPTLATVSDIKKLGSQPFFTEAENGDKVLIYEKSGKAIIWRPSLNKIINFSSINRYLDNIVAETVPQPTSLTPSPTVAPIKISILNGTKKAGLARTAQTKLKDSNIDINATLGNAINDQESTIVVDVTGTNTVIVDKIVKSLPAKKGQLPEGENVGEEVQVVVILGSDFATTSN